MLRALLDFFRTRPDAEPLTDPDEVRNLYQAKRRSVFVSLVLGYGFFYTTRLSLSVTKKEMMETGVLDATQLGVVGATLLYVYAFGKLINGFLADGANVSRFMSTALLCSALVNLVFGRLSAELHLE